jgi:hypothetical protein
MRCDKHYAPAALPQGKTSAPVVQEGGRATGPVWMGMEKRKSLVPSGFRTSYPAACTEDPYLIHKLNVVIRYWLFRKEFGEMLLLICHVYLCDLV